MIGSLRPRGHLWGPEEYFWTRRELLSHLCVLEYEGLLKEVS
jgi:hypothetical protein